MIYSLQINYLLLLFKKKIYSLFSLDNRQLNDPHSYNDGIFLVVLLAYNQLLCDQKIRHNCSICRKFKKKKQINTFANQKKTDVFLNNHLVFRKRFVRLRFLALPCKSLLFGPVTNVASTPLSLSLASKSTTSFSPNERNPPIRRTLFITKTQKLFF